MSKTRIHAIILTSERTEALRRCISNALRSIDGNDVLTIIDDSGNECFSANSALLKDILSTHQYSHLRAVGIENRLRRALPISNTLWLDKSAKRDIAPLRNMSLLLALGISAITTILIDDDICGFDLFETHNQITSLANSDKSMILGAHIGGISEHDTITRMHEAIDRIDAQGDTVTDVKSLFRVNGCSAPSARTCRYVSAGYVAFQLVRQQLFAFPPGYNEDWLWCLLQRGDPKIRIDESAQKVLHEPPSVLKPTHADLQFEFIGDFVFECLEQLETDGSNIESRLNALSQQIPHSSFMPLLRVRDLLTRGETSTLRNRLGVLDEFGLAQMREMWNLGQVNIDGPTVLKTWCKDAVAKHNAFAATLLNESVISTLRS